MTRQKWVISKFKLAVTFVLPVLIAILKPLEFTQHQAVILAAIVLVITWWITEVVDKTISAIILLLVFTFFSDQPLKMVYYFPTSTSFILVSSSFLLAKGIINNGIARRISNKLIVKQCKNTKDLVTITFVISFMLTFMIPNPFSRIILLSGIYVEMLRHQKIVGMERKIIMLAVSVSSIAASMLLINGDVILNYSAIRLSGIGMTGSDWIEVMTLPAAISCILIWLVFKVFMFKELVSPLDEELEESKAITLTQKLSLMIMMGVIAMWFTENYHHIDSAYPALVGVVLMLFTGSVKIKDHHAVNYRLLVFMTAIFAVGKILVGDGIAQKISSALIQVFPAPESAWYLIALISGTILIHLMLGSSLTTMSIIMAPFMALTEGVLDPVVVAMLIYLIVNIHFILPIHNAALLVGYGEKHFDTPLLAKFGSYMTVGIFVLIYGVFFPWWRLIGLM
jgi:di/tricarboxylate transporter